MSSRAEDKKNIESSEIAEKKSNVAVRKKEHNTGHSLNRLSVLSAESDQKSSQSVEVLSFQSGNNTDCTNSPDSEVNSSSASGQKLVNSESVEILPDSLVTSPSSVEVINDWKSDDESSYMSPMDERLFETSITPTPSNVSLCTEYASEGGSYTHFFIAHLFTLILNVFAYVLNYRRLEKLDEYSANGRLAIVEFLASKSKYFTFQGTTNFGIQPFSFDSSGKRRAEHISG